MTETSPELSPKSTKILLFATPCPSCCSHGRPGWSRGAKMASQGAPEVPNPRCSRGAKMGPRNIKKEVPSPQNGNPDMPKGAGGRGRSSIDIEYSCHSLKFSEGFTNIGVLIIPGSF